jgi:hypothetical protein
MKNREIGAILSAFEKFSTMNFSKVDKMAPISPFSHFPVANFSAQRSTARGSSRGSTIPYSVEEQKSSTKG